MEKIKVNITDRDGNDVFVGDRFEARMTNTQIKPTIVSVVSDTSKKNLEIDRDFDVEDKDGLRIWNAYMVIKNRNKIN